MIIDAVQESDHRTILKILTLQAASFSTVFWRQSAQTKYVGSTPLEALPKMHLVCCHTLHSSHSIMGRPSSFFAPHTHFTTQPSLKALLVENSLSYTCKLTHLELLETDGLGAM